MLLGETTSWLWERHSFIRVGSSVTPRQLASMSSPQLVASNVVACSKFTDCADASDGIATIRPRIIHRIRCIARFHTIHAAMVKASCFRLDNPNANELLRRTEQFEKDGNGVRVTPSVAAVPRLDKARGPCQ